jgi:hypothetical protein
VIEGGATSDNWIDVPQLQWDAHFKKFVPDAFAALGVCAELWKTEYTINSWAGTQADFNVAIINDLDSSFRDYFVVRIMKGDSVLSSTQYRYDVQPFEIARTPVKIELPKMAGDYEVITELNGRKNNVVRSYRQIRMVQ